MVTPPLPPSALAGGETQGAAAMPLSTDMLEFDSKLLASLPNDGRDEGVVRLNDTREEMVDQ